MNLLLVAVLLLQDKGATPPTRPLDPMDASSVVEHAVFNTRSQKSFETTFKARYTPPKGNDLDYSGKNVWVSPGVLYLGYTATGGEEQKIIRAGDDVWVYSAVAGSWLTAAGAGVDGAARGIQNPVEVLGMIGKHAAVAKWLKPGVVELNFGGDDLLLVLKNHVDANTIVWDQSSVRVELAVDGDPRLIKTFSCAASLLANAPAFNGTLKYTMDVTFTSFNTPTELKFSDEKNRPLPPTPEMKEKMERVLGGRK